MSNVQAIKQQVERRKAAGRVGVLLQVVEADDLIVQSERLSEAGKLAHRGVMALLDHNLPAVRSCLKQIEALANGGSGSDE